MKNLFLALTIIFSSCSSNKESDKSRSLEETFIGNSQAIRGYISEKPVEFYTSNKEEYNNERDKIPSLAIYGRIQDWKEADKVIKAYIRVYDENIYAWDKVHHYAVLMLDKYLNQEPLNDEIVHATEFYVSLMVKYNTYETQILGESLKRLNGYWSKEKISKIAKFGLIQRDKFLEESRTSNLYKKELEEIQENSKYLLKSLE
jgi:hypothetical protein